MAITFNADDRKSISLQILDLPLAAQTATDSKADIETLEADLLDQDDDIKKFYDLFNGNVEAYQNERRWLDGTTYTEVLESQIQAAARNDDGNIYFPTSDTFTWVNYQPYIDPSESNLKGEPITSSGDHEQEITSNDDDVQGLTFLIDLLKNGQAGSAIMMVTASYDGTNTVTLSPTATASLPVGNYVLIGTDTVVRVDSEDLPQESYTVTPILTTGAASGTATSALPGYSNSQRNSLTGPEQDYLDALVDAIKNRVDDWEISVNNQLTELNANEDDRSPQASEITAAISDANNAISIIDAWQALPDTGTTGSDSKFTDNNLLTLENEITARSSFASTRASQVSTALGTLSQASDGTVSGSGAFRLRYDQLNNRINRIGGPLSEHYEKGEAVRALTQLADTKNSALDTFTDSMKATALTVNGDGTNVIQVEDSSDFSPGQTVYVVSNTQSEITGTISSVDSATQMTLSFSVSSAFTVADRARILRIV